MHSAMSDLKRIRNGRSRLRRQIGAKDILLYDLSTQLALTKVGHITASVVGVEPVQHMQSRTAWLWLQSICSLQEVRYMLVLSITSRAASRNNDHMHAMRTPS